ncbi:MAG: hypothetical protein ACJ8G2_11575 [Burkholderiales bacterium]
MKHATAWFIVTWTLAMPTIHAADEDEHAAHRAPAAQSNPAEAIAKDEAARMKMKIHDEMKKMQEQMERIHATTDPLERRKLMEEHMQTMRETMKTMHGIGSDMMGKKQGEPMMKEGGKGADNGMDKERDKGGMQMGMMMKKRHQMMEDRMDMMQKMMEQMLEHEAAEQELEH